MDDRLLQFLGIAWRARAMIVGEYPCLSAIRAGRGSLLILAQDASANTADRLQAAANYRSIPCIVTRSKAQLGRAIGQNQRVALLVTDRNFARKLEELARE
ncbi:MAG TPA: 50S ribosomal protein L7ae [Firmicutes bacterium]|jgi:ribosomal protein L7Ae-like RNA K-turn-binding protein|nr:50S ribosomal protein L7ae [Bacillota bacterium]